MRQVALSLFFYDLFKEPGHPSIGLVNIVQDVVDAGIWIQYELKVHIGAMSSQDFLVEGVCPDVLQVSSEEDLRSFEGRSNHPLVCII